MNIADLRDDLIRLAPQTYSKLPWVVDHMLREISDNTELTLKLTGKLVRLEAKLQTAIESK